MTTLDPIISNVVKRNSIIHTDCYKGYSNLKNMFFNHLTVNHSRNFKDPNTGVHTNTIEGNWCSIKRKIPYRCRTKDLVSLHLVKFMLRRNHKDFAF